MEDKSTSNDDGMKDYTLTSILGSKKLKLNDGSSQDSYKESDTSKKEDNVDSGVSADKSESTSSEERGIASSEPSNELLNAAPSSSNVHTILLNIRRPKRGRNYRKRKTPDRSTDSNDSSRDSDDLSVEENILPSRQSHNSNSETESDDVLRFVHLGDSDSGDSTSSSSNSTSNSNDSFESNDMMSINSGYTDSDEDALWPIPNINEAMETEGNKNKLPDVLMKTRPKHSYMMLRDVINRELGLSFPSNRTTNCETTFEKRFYGSLHAIHRLGKLHQLNKHRGCVNSINFHPEGQLLASGSDDQNVIVWDWARNKALHTIKTGHKSNVFQSKFLHLNAASQLNIVTCARDGQVRLVQCPSSGGPGSRRRLTSHSSAAHKLHVSAHNPHLVLSAGEDGIVMQCDVRAEHAIRMFHVKERGASVALYSVTAHPLEPRELMVAGRDRFVRVFDRRRASRPLALYCPSVFHEHAENPKKRVRLSLMHLTCAIYNHDGTEILASYNDEDIYLFNAKHDFYDKDNPDSKEGYTHRYSGHRNSATFKGVSFFGPKSEYVVSGSDCSHIYIWDRETEAIVQWLQGDNHGVVNCIEAHPCYPVLATSGLDKDVKIWLPKSGEDPTYAGLQKIVRANSESQLRSPLFNDFLPSFYNEWHDSRGGGARDSHTIEFDGNVCTAF